MRNFGMREKCGGQTASVDMCHDSRLADEFSHTKSPPQIPIPDTEIELYLFIYKNLHLIIISEYSHSLSFSLAQALSGFLMMLTQNGKLLYISDNAAEYLGHSMVSQWTRAVQCARPCNFSFDLSIFRWCCESNSNLLICAHVVQYTLACARWNIKFSCELTNDRTRSNSSESHSRVRQREREGGGGEAEECTKKINLFICGRFAGDILSDQCAIAWESMERVKLLPTGAHRHLTWLYRRISFLAAGQSRTAPTTGVSIERATN